MVTKKPKLSRNAEYQKRQREHYRQFLLDDEGHPVLVNGRPYNPVLDEPKDEDRNRLGWTHGLLAGYLTAGCRCTLCTAANTQAQAAADERRVADRRSNDRQQVRDMLVQRHPDLAGDVHGRIAVAVCSTARTTLHNKGSRRLVRAAYQQTSVVFAVKAVLGEAGVEVWPETELREFADLVTTELSR